MNNEKHKTKKEVFFLLNEKLVDNKFKLVLNDSIDSVDKSALVCFLGNHVGLVRIVDIDRIRDAPSNQRRRVMKKLGTEHVIVHFESAFRGQILELWHLACHTYES